jgi:hypothetical protein
MPFLLDNFAKFFAGSTPIIFLKPRFLKGSNPTPSLLPISIIKEFFFSFRNLIYFFEALLK